MYTVSASPRLAAFFPHLPLVITLSSKRVNQFIQDMQLLREQEKWMTTEHTRQSRGIPVDVMRGARQDMFENPEAKLRYQVYRCEYQRYEAYRYEDGNVKDVKSRLYLVNDQLITNTTLCCIVAFNQHQWLLVKASLFQRLLP
jgi:hypothetical protein